MNEEIFSKEIGEHIRNRHLCRRMYAIIDGQLKVDESNDPRHHWEWFVEEGWIKDLNDPIFAEIVRGNVTNEGDLHFYIGKDFGIDIESERIFFKFLPEIIKKMNVNPGARILGGKIKGDILDDLWPPQKEYGFAKDYSN